MSETADGRAILTALFEQHHDRVYRFLLARSGSAQVAEDVASDTFTDVARMCASGRGGEITEAWLMTVARRRLVDSWRGAERHRRRVQRVSQLRPKVGAAADAGHDDLVVAALQSLADRQRLALTLRYLDDLSVAEVAEHLEMTYRAAESLLARARKSFERAYREGGRP